MLGSTNAFNTNCCDAGFTVNHITSDEGVTFLLHHDIKGMTPAVLSHSRFRGVAPTDLRACMTRDVRDAQSLV